MAEYPANALKAVERSPKQEAEHRAAGVIGMRHGSVDLTTAVRHIGMAEDDRTAAIRVMDDYALSATRRLFTWFRDEMVEMANRDVNELKWKEDAFDGRGTPAAQTERTCVTCPHADKCRALLTPGGR